MSSKLKDIIRNLIKTELNQISIKENFENIWKKFENKDYFGFKYDTDNKIKQWKNAVKNGDKNALKYSEEDIRKFYKDKEISDAKVIYNNIKKYIDDKNIIELKKILKPNHKFAIACFEDITGKKLPLNQAAILSLIDMMFNLDETSSVSSMAGGDGYMTPGAFSRPDEDQKKKKALKNNTWKIVDESIDQLERPMIIKLVKGPYKGKKIKVTHSIDGKHRTNKQYEYLGIINGKEQFIPNEWLDLKNLFGESVDFKNKELTPQHRLQKAVSHARKQMNEIEKIVNRAVKFKTENNVSNDIYWNRTNLSLRKLAEQLVRISNKLNDFK